MQQKGIKPGSSVCRDIGLFVGEDKLSPESHKRFRNSIGERGLLNLSASAFIQLVLNYPIGVCSRLFGFKGASSWFCTDLDSGLMALYMSALYLNSHSNTKSIIAAGIHEPENISEIGYASGMMIHKAEEKSRLQLIDWRIGTDLNELKSNLLSQLKPKDNVSDLHFASNLKNQAISGIIEFFIQNEKKDGYLLVTNSGKSTNELALLFKFNKL